MCVYASHSLIGEKYIRPLSMEQAMEPGIRAWHFWVIVTGPLNISHKRTNKAVVSHSYGDEWTHSYDQQSLAGRFSSITITRRSPRLKIGAD